ncbi:MAG: molybdenum cofactor carrier [Chlorobiaceae bacterium]|nr:molybdenum cofactor carrier [Chlorobiaceae bacterium]
MLSKIVSGGQTGVDRGALDAAIASGLDHAGWCPKGRKAEEGSIPACYRLCETPSSRYAERTEWNVRDSCGTLVLSCGALRGGTKLTVKFARRYGRPCLVVALDGRQDAGDVAKWIRESNIEVLNVAGPRESSRPGIETDARRFVAEVICRDRSHTPAGS